MRYAADASRCPPSLSFHPLQMAVLRHHRRGYEQMEMSRSDQGVYIITQRRSVGLSIAHPTLSPSLSVLFHVPVYAHSTQRQRQHVYTVTCCLYIRTHTHARTWSLRKERRRSKVRGGGGVTAIKLLGPCPSCPGPRQMLYLSAAFRPVSSSFNMFIQDDDDQYEQHRHIDTRSVHFTRRGTCPSSIETAYHSQQSSEWNNTQAVPRRLCAILYRA